MHQVIEINSNFNTWDLAQNFKSSNPRYQLAVVVAQYRTAAPQPLGRRDFGLTVGQAGLSIVLSLVG